MEHIDYISFAEEVGKFMAEQAEKEKAARAKPKAKDYAHSVDKATDEACQEYPIPADINRDLINYISDEEKTAGYSTLTEENGATQAEKRIQNYKAVLMKLLHHASKDGYIGSYTLYQMYYEAINQRMYLKDPEGELRRAEESVYGPGHIGDIVFRYYMEVKEALISNLETKKLKKLGKKNIHSVDPTLSFNSMFQNMQESHGHYISVPLYAGDYLSAPDQKKNRELLYAYVARKYGSSGGCSVLLEAGVGTGKSYLAQGEMASMLGLICKTDVYMIMPTTAQVIQMSSEYNCFVKTAEMKTKEPGEHPSLRVYIYDLIDGINIITKVNGEGRPVIIIIDEAHSLLTETYRGPVLDMITNKVHKILEAGGAAIAITATTEAVRATIPYNMRTGYDLIFKVFRVSSKSSFALRKEYEVIPCKYPDYSYDDLIAANPPHVHVEDSLPVDEIQVIYKAPSLNLISSVYAEILRLHDEGYKLLVELNNKEDLFILRKELESKGIHAVICSGSDKDGDTNSTTGTKIYHNSTYNNIVNHACIDLTETDVVLTTKLLENGTSIKEIICQGADSEALASIRYKMASIFVVDNKASYLSIEAFEQFSGRLRFKHHKAVLLMPKPYVREDGSAADMQWRAKRLKQTIRSESALEEMEIPADRLNYHDLRGAFDFSSHFVPGAGYMSSSPNLSQKAYELVQAYYKGLMHDLLSFENAIKNRYPRKNVIFTDQPDSEATLARSNKLEPSQSVKISEIVESLINDISGSKSDDKPEDRKSLSTELRRALIDSGHAGKVEDLNEIVKSVAALKRFINKVEALPTPPENKPLIPADLADAKISDRVMKAINAPNKKDGKGLLRQLHGTSYANIRPYCGQALATLIKDYAPQFARYDSNSKSPQWENLICDVNNLKKYIPEDIRSEGMELIHSLVESPELNRIFRLLSSCPTLKCTPNLLADLLSFPESKIEQMQTIYQFYSLAHNPNMILPQTRFGVTYAAITGEEAYYAAGYDGEYTGLNSWKNKRITKNVAYKIYTVCTEHLIHNAMKYNSNINAGSLYVLRGFASIFSFDPRMDITGNAFIVLQDLRKKYPANYNMILELTFSAKKKTSVPENYAEFENSSGDN